MDENGRYSGEYYPFTLAGFIRKKGSDSAACSTPRSILIERGGELLLTPAMFDVSI